MKKTIFYLIGIISFWSCQTATHEHVKNLNERNTLAVLYVQQSPEYKALAEQAYYQARVSLDKQIAKSDQRLAIVTDIDETVLDNSPYAAKQILENVNYPKYWDEWINKADAQPIPGSLSFFKHADSLGVAIFYISNRKVHLLDATIKNLNKFGYPQADSTHIYLRTSTSSKEDRRNKVLEQGYTIALFLGDNLDDMGSQFETKDRVARADAEISSLDKFGTKYIVLPNPTYGKWAENMELYNSKLNQDSIAAVYLKSF